MTEYLFHIFIFVSRSRPATLLILRKPQDAHAQIECRIRNLHNVAAGGTTDS